jgi:hypothetical protein
MKVEENKDCGLLLLGELTNAERFQDGVPMARALPAMFPVLSTTLGIDDYLALEAAADSVVSFKMEVVHLASATLLKVTFEVGELCVHWLADESASDLWSAIDVWCVAGKAAFAMALPEGVPFNCIFGAIEWTMPTEMKELANAQEDRMSADSWDVLTAMVEAGNQLHHTSIERRGSPNRRELVNLLLTNRIRDVIKHVPLTARTDLCVAGVVSETVH